MENLRLACWKDVSPEDRRNAGIVTESWIRRESLSGHPFVPVHKARNLCLDANPYAGSCRYFVNALYLGPHFIGELISTGRHGLAGLLCFGSATGVVENMQQRQLVLLIVRLHRDGASRAERATRRGIGRIRHIAEQDDSLAFSSSAGP